MRESRTHTQPKCDAGQHHGRIDRRNAQVNPSLGMRPYSSSPPSPPAAAVPTATSTSVILPYARHDVTRPCVCNHAHANATSHDEFHRPTVPSKHCKHADDATASTTGDDDAIASTTGDAHDGTLLCSQPATHRCPQPTAAELGTLLTGRGGKRLLN